MFDQLADLADTGRVQSVAGFVQDQQFRVLEQGRGDAEPLLHAQRVTLDPIVGPAPQVHQLEHLIDPDRGDPGGLGQQRQIQPPGEIGEEQRRLDQRSETSGNSPGTLRPNIFSDPESGRTKPSNSRMVVVLPDPFGPRNPNPPPASTVRSNPRTACSGGLRQWR